MSNSIVQANKFWLIQKLNYLQTNHLKIIYVYIFKYVQINDC